MLVILVLLGLLAVTILVVEVWAAGCKWNWNNDGLEKTKLPGKQRFLFRALEILKYIAPWPW
ncbi:MAG: hypothetical protein HY316_01725 [Acidobacteria bacterium]|nr:hypothetical protein [Acidobacteriota bacterium]